MASFGFEQLTEEVLHGMSFEEIDAHCQHVKVDARQPYLDLVLTALHDSAIEEKHVAYDDVGFEISGGGRGRSLAVPLDWCDNDEWKDEYKQIEGKQAQVVRDHAAKKITELETENGIFNTPVRLKYHLENDKSDPEYDLNCKFDSKIQFKWQI